MINHNSPGVPDKEQGRQKLFIKQLGFASNGKQTTLICISSLEKLHH